MSAPASTETYEQFMASLREMREQLREDRERLRETDRIVKETALSMKETDARMKETAEQMKVTDKRIGNLGNRIGDMVEGMVGGGKLVAQFRALGYDIISYSRGKTFGPEGTDESGQIDLFLEDGDIAILVEVKTKLSNADVLEHVERLEKYRAWIETRSGDKRRFIGAVAGDVVERNVAQFALKQGFYVIVQTGVDIEIIAPENFVPKEW